jgi:DNA-binding transcriptional ArsR family regulator
LSRKFDDEAPPREILEGAGDPAGAGRSGPHCHRAAAAVVVAVCARTGRRPGLPQPLVSQHLRILKAAGVVAGERCGREVHYRLVDQHLAHIVLDAVAHAGEDR